jgi:hypothetical protein
MTAKPPSPLALPSLREAEALLAQAAHLNPGRGWVAHSRVVADAAGRIAAAHPALDESTARVLGLLHDIGRRAGDTHNRHILDGYTYLMGLGYPAAARICLTHSFPVPDITVCDGTWDTTPAEYAFLRQAVAAATYDEYDRLIQLCDALSLPDGFCLLEKRLVDVALRHGVSDQTPTRWRALFDLRDRFSAAVGGSIYGLLPGVVAGTFGGPAT